MVTVSSILCSKPKSNGDAPLSSRTVGSSRLTSMVTLGVMNDEISSNLLTFTATCPNWNFPVSDAFLDSLITFRPGVNTKG